MLLGNKVLSKNTDPRTEKVRGGGDNIFKHRYEDQISCIMKRNSLYWPN